MSITAAGLRAYANAQQTFKAVESGLQQAAGTRKNSTFAQTLDQTLIRDTVDKAENFGAHADFIKQRVAEGVNTVNPNSFTETVGNSMKRLQALQQSRDTAIEDFASGRSQNVHELMITMQKASLAMNLTSAVRGKVIEAYKELSRITF